MADISKIKLPNNTVVNIKDSRIPGVDTEPTSGSDNVVTSGGTYTAIQNAIGSVYKYKGTKANYASLPSSGNVTGDVWNVEAAYGDYPAGTNWAWTGSGWDALGGEVDLSAYQTTATADSKYVTALGTSGNNLTWTKNGTTNNITVPFATTASKIGSATVGSSKMPIYLNSGAPTAISSFPEAYLSWGGKNLLGYSPLDAAMVGDIGSNKLAFMPASKIDVFYTTDGTTWLDYEATDAQKIGLVSGIDVDLRTGKNTTVDAHTTGHKLRIVFSAGNLYTVLNKFILYVTCANNPSEGWCDVEARTRANYNANNDTWVKFVDHQKITGWSGYDVFNTAGITFGTGSSQYYQIRFTIGMDSAGSNSATVNPPTTYGIRLTRLYGFGGEGWVLPSNMAKSGHLYNYDYQQNAIFPNGIRPQNNNASYLGANSTRWSNIYSVLGNFSGELTANSFIKSGGTSSQFLKADGSVDSTSYATVSALNNKQDTLTFDTTPVASSTNPVTSGGLNTEFGKVSYVGDNLGTETYIDSGSVVTDLSGYATKAWVEAKGYLTTETDPSVYSWAKAATKPTYTASEVGALPDTTEIPSKMSDLTNDMGFITGYTETDPTVPSWAKASTKPTYSASEITNDVGYVKYVLLQSESDMPASPDSGTLYLIPET